MNIWRAFWRWFTGANLPAIEPEPPRVEPRPLSARQKMREALRKALELPKGAARAGALRELFPIPDAPPGVPESAKLAMDESVNDIYGYASGGLFGEGIAFLGYQYLAELTQRPQYRVPCEIIAKEMTRKWIKFNSSGDGDKTPKITAIEKEFKRLKVRQHFLRATEHEGEFGRGMIYIDTGATDKPEELAKPLLLKPNKIAKGSMLALRVVEPMWTYPNTYNSNDPLRPDYFAPQFWFVQGKLVHRSRLLTLVSRPVPDILKPSYMFGGLPLSQLLKPTVDNFLRSRQSVSDLLASFSMPVLKTDMQSVMQEQFTDTYDLDDRADYFNATRDNRGLQIINKDSEEMEILAVPLGTVDALQAKSQEFMAADAQIPLVKLLGITPSGLNASSDGEVRVFYDSIHARQEDEYTDPLTTILHLVQLRLFGEIDEEIGFSYVPLWQLDAAALAAVQKSKADTDAVRIADGVISPLEARVALAADVDSGYDMIDVDDLPEPPDAGLEPDGSEASAGGNPAKSAEPKAVEREGE